MSEQASSIQELPNEKMLEDNARQFYATWSAASAAVGIARLHDQPA
jgi:hypothetical protein